MVSFRAVLAGLGLATVAQLPSCLAFPTTNLSLGYDLYDENALLKRQEDDNEKPFWLRIMPLGASITAGTNGPPGSDGNGYRKFLRDKLRLDGWQVNMVGTFQHGTMNDNVRPTPKSQSLAFLYLCICVLTSPHRTMRACQATS